MTRHTRRPSARRTATRRRLLDGARRVFAEQGVNGSTVEDICEAAGFTRGAFYSNFDAKEDLVVALMAIEEETIVAALTEAIEKRRSRNQEYDIRGVVDLFVAAQPLDREHALMQAEFRMYAIRNPEVAGQLISSRETFLGQLGALFESGMERTGRRLKISTADAVLMMLGVTETSLRDELTRGAGEWEGLPGLAMVLITLIEAVSEPIEAPG